MKHEVGGPPFWKADPRAWPDIVEMMTASGRAWPECVIREDLRWMLDQIRVERMDRIPGRPSLRKRWNVSDRQVRNALRALGGGRTASGQRADSERTASGQESGEESAFERVERTASGQRADSERTAGVHTRVEDRSTDQTDHRSDPSVGLPAAGEIEEPEVVVEIAKATPVETWKREAAVEVYRAYHLEQDTITGRPASPPPETWTEIDDGERSVILRALTQVAKAEKVKRKGTRYERSDVQAATGVLIDVIQWIHRSPEARFWQGFNDAGQKHLGLDVILRAKKLGDKRTKAVVWAQRGRAQNAMAGTQGYAEEAENAWKLLDRFARRGSLPEQVSNDPEREAAFRSALREVGWLEVKRCPPAGEAALKARWITAYTSARAHAKTVTDVHTRRSHTP